MFAKQKNKKQKTDVMMVEDASFRYTPFQKRKKRKIDQKSVKTQIGAVFYATFLHNARESHNYWRENREIVIYFSFGTHNTMEVDELLITMGIN